MKVIVEIKKQLFKDFYLVAGSALGIYILYNGGIVIERCLHGSKDNGSTSLGIAKEIYDNGGIKGFFKGTTFSIGYKVALETLKDVHSKLFGSGSGNSSNSSNNSNNSNNSNSNTSALNKNSTNNNNSLYNRIKNKLKFNRNSNSNNSNNSNSSVINIKINNSSSAISTSTSSDGNSINIVFNKVVYKSEFLNILNQVLECPLYLIRDCIVISPTQFKFKEFFKSLKSIHIIKLLGYYAGICILKSYGDVLIDIIVQHIQNSTNEKKSSSSLFNYLKFIILINDNLIIKSYLQSIILCPLDFIRIQYSLKILESMDFGVPIGSYIETSIPSPYAILKSHGSHVYNGFNISFINNILANILIKYLNNIELILNLIIITKNQIKPIKSTK